MTINWAFMKKWDYLTSFTLLASWETWIQVKKQQLEPSVEQWTGYKFGKEYDKDVYCYLVYLPNVLSTSWGMLCWVKHKVESTLPGDISITSDMQVILCKAEREELDSLLMKVIEKSEKCGLKFNIQKTGIIASGPIISWHVEGEKWNQWQTLFSWSPKSLLMVTADMKLRHLFLGRKAMTNLDSVLKSRNITLPTKFHIVKTMVFPVVMYRCKSWIIKEAECCRVGALNCGVGEDS